MFKQTTTCKMYIVHQGVLEELKYTNELEKSKLNNIYLFKERFKNA